jgi:hypothetical protein
MRKTETVVIEREGRDKGKTFLITEMPAMQAEKWAARALLALGRAGVEIPDDAMGLGAAAIISAGLGAFRQMNFVDAEPLLDEMMSCVQIVPDPTKKDATTQAPIVRALIDGDIEEVATLAQLRSEVIEVHTGFSVTAALSKLGAAVVSKRSATPTSRPQSGSSSGAGSRRSTKRKPSTA